MNQLNLPEFRVLKVEENEQRDLKFTVEAINPQAECPECYTNDCYKHAPMERFVRDLSMFSQRVGVSIQGHRYKCKECGKTFTEQFESVDERDKITLRLKEHIKVVSLKEPFAKIAEEFSLSPTTVKRIFSEYVEEEESTMTFRTPQVLGIDEVHLNREMRAVFTDVKNQKILEMLPKRSKPTIINFLDKLPDKHVIKVVTTDMWMPYRDAVKLVLPSVPLVVDKFHVVQYGNKALDTIRKSFKDSLTSKQKITLKNDRFTLLKNQEDLSVGEILKRDSWFGLFPTLEIAYSLKEGLRDIYKCQTKEHAELYYKHWKTSIPEDMKPFHEVAKTIDNWHTEIFNYFDHFVTNAYTESINNIIKHIERRGRGYSFEVLRAKVLFGTRATVRPRYNKVDDDYRRIGRAMYITEFDFTPPKLLEGFGVSIPQLLKVIERDDF